MTIERSSRDEERALAERLDTRNETATQWIGFLLGPLVALCNVSFGYMAVNYACARESSVSLHLITLVSALLVGASGFAAHRSWTRAGRGEPGEHGTIIDRSRFMGFTGILTNALMLASILAFWLPVLLLDPCQ
jgi:hypothetical protein